MELEKLLLLLEEKINEKMAEFTKLGKESKKLLQQAHEKECAMAKLYMELEPVHAIVREQNPTLCELFDSLVLLDKDSKYKEADGNK